MKKINSNRPKSLPYKYDIRKKMSNKRLSCQELYNPGKASPIGGFGNFTFKKRRGGFDDKSTGFTVCIEDADIVTTART
jgi:hypothetical protein